MSRFTAEKLPQIGRRGFLSSVSCFAIAPFISFKTLASQNHDTGVWLGPDILPGSVSVRSCADAPRQPRRQEINLLNILRATLDEHKIPMVWKSQRHGTCVGQSGAVACDCVMAVNWLLSGHFLGRASVAVIYAGSRVEVANRPGSWAGSNCSWASQFVTKWGIGLLKDIGLPETSLIQDEDLAREWTESPDGVPQGHEDIARTRPVLRSPQVTTIDELLIALEAGAPVVTGTRWIANSGVDKNGVGSLYWSRRYGHATVFSAVRYRNGDPEFLYTNSHGEQWGEGGCVWLTARDTKRILGSNDSYAFVGVAGLSPLKL